MDKGRVTRYGGRLGADASYQGTIGEVGKDGSTAGVQVQLDITWITAYDKFLLRNSGHGIGLRYAYAPDKLGGPAHQMDLFYRRFTFNGLAEFFAGPSYLSGDFVSHAAGLTGGLLFRSARIDKPASGSQIHLYGGVELSSAFYLGEGVGVDPILFRTGLFAGLGWYR